MPGWHEANRPCAQLARTPEVTRKEAAAGARDRKTHTQTRRVAESKPRKQMTRLRPRETWTQVPLGDTVDILSRDTPGIPGSGLWDGLGKEARRLGVDSCAEGQRWLCWGAKVAIPSPATYI